jgi:VIT1/CCC1 family predicted Fe2+/Mn2+ transporter
MSGDGGAAARFDRWLDPSERLDEVLFGLIMTLTFTLGSGLTAEEGPEGVRQLLLAALGCNVAWGLIDGVMCVMQRVSERSRRLRLLRDVRLAEGRDAALALIRGELDETLGPIAEEAAREGLYSAVLERLRGTGQTPPLLRKEDLYAGVASFCLVFGATLPAVVPFLLFSDKFLALRASNAVLLLSLFATGWRWASWIGAPRLAIASAMTAMGIVLVVAAISFGG